MSLRLLALTLGLMNIGHAHSQMADDVYPSLELVSAIPIDNPVDMSDSDPLEPSGLCFFEGSLLMVSDQHDFVFTLEKGPKSYIPVEWMDLRGMTGPATSDAGTVSRVSSWMRAKWFGSNLLELEGIACEKETVWIASRFHNRLAIITIFAKVINWPGERAMATATHPSTTRAGITGVAVDTSTVYISTNADSGEVIADDGTTPKKLSITTQAQTDETGALTDITFDPQGSMWTLSGGQRVVCKLTHDTTQQECWSFLTAKLEKELGYENGEHGLADGIALSETAIHIALDNNGENRLSSNDDQRPQLLTFKRPDVRQRP